MLTCETPANKISDRRMPNALQRKRGRYKPLCAASRLQNPKPKSQTNDIRYSDRRTQKPKSQTNHIKPRHKHPLVFETPNQNHKRTTSNPDANNLLSSKPRTRITNVTSETLNLNRHLLDGAPHGLDGGAHGLDGGE